MKILPRKYYHILMPLVIAFMMSIIMSGYVTFLNLGFSELYFSQWFSSWWRAFSVALPISYFVIPLVRKFLDSISYDD
ncbi:MAG: DUF2798 domain-containing protein [Patescibacteria group bacterium]|nr:DUF2798 domain-containing protein [Patescibacteria group bacterium]